MSQWNYESQEEADFWQEPPYMPEENPEDVPPTCKWCDEDYDSHKCRECQVYIAKADCEANQGLCCDCRAIQEGRL